MFVWYIFWVLRGGWGFISRVWRGVFVLFSLSLVGNDYGIRLKGGYERDSGL